VGISLSCECDPNTREREFTFQNARTKKPFSENEQSARKRIEVYVLTIKHTHRDNFVDRFLRRRGLGDDLDASKLGGECKHLFISIGLDIFVTQKKRETWRSFFAQNKQPLAGKRSL